MLQTWYFLKRSQTDVPCMLLLKNKAGLLSCPRRILGTCGRIVYTCTLRVGSFISIHSTQLKYVWIKRKVHVCVFSLQYLKCMVLVLKEGTVVCQKDLLYWGLVQHYIINYYFQYNTSNLYEHILFYSCPYVLQQMHQLTLDVK